MYSNIFATTLVSKTINTLHIYKYVKKTKFSKNA